MAQSTFFIDLDDTLYPASSGLWMAIRQRIDLFVAKKLDLPAEQASVVHEDLFHKYGTTLRGLQAVYQVDDEEYLNFVHDVPLGSYIGPNPALKKTLMAYPQRKVIFTNAHAPHARRVTAALELDGCFDRIIDIYAIHPHCKPMPEAFQAAFDLLDVDPKECVLIDDTLSNLVTGKSLGMHTIWISDELAAPTAAADAVIPVLENLPCVMAAGRNGRNPGED